MANSSLEWLTTEILINVTFMESPVWECDIWELNHAKPSCGKNSYRRLRVAFKGKMFFCRAGRVIGSHLSLKMGLSEGCPWWLFIEGGSSEFCSQWRGRGPVALPYRFYKYIYSALTAFTLFLLFSYINLDSGKARVVRYRSLEPAYVDQVRVWYSLVVFSSTPQ